mgnify:CR=1 FL=1
MKVYIINPDNGQPVAIEQWRKEADPTRAELLELEMDNGHALLLRKSYLPEGPYKFEDAQKACAEYRPKGFEVFTFRAPTRKECIDLYDARFTAGLDEAIGLLKGDFAHNDNGNWIWTSERDSDPQFVTVSAWVFPGNNGYVDDSSFCVGYQALPVALFK